MTDSTGGREVLARRARELARPLDAAGTAVRAEGMSSLLIVRLVEDRVGIALEHITEVHRASELTPIPGASPPVVGVIAWRGRVLTVLDIASNRSAAIAVSDATRILVIGQARAVFGILVDDVEGVEDVNVHDAAPLADASPGRREFVRGVMADALVVLDPAALIARFAPTQ